MGRVRVRVRAKVRAVRAKVRAVRAKVRAVRGEEG